MENGGGWQTPEKNTLKRMIFFWTWVFLTKWSLEILLNFDLCHFWRWKNWGTSSKPSWWHKGSVWSALWWSSDVGCCSDCRLNQGSYVNKTWRVHRSSLLIKITRKTQRKRNQSTDEFQRWRSMEKGGGWQTAEKNTLNRMIFFWTWKMSNVNALM